MDFIYIKYKYTTYTCMQKHLHDKPIQLIDICVLYCRNLFVKISQ